MVDVKVDPPPQRKRKVETSESSATATKESNINTEPEWDSDDNEFNPREKEIYRQYIESDGFDADGCLMKSITLWTYKCLGTSEDPIDIFLYGRLGLHCHNLQKGTNLRLLCLEKYNILYVVHSTYYITLEAIDPASNSRHTFQTAVTDYLFSLKEKLKIETEICRLKPRTLTKGFEVSGEWEDAAVDDFYKGVMPIWCSDDALTLDNKLQNCYKVRVQDLDSTGTEYLRLYCEIALYEKAMFGRCSDSIYKSSTPLEMKQIYVQTLETVSPVWNAMNAIFYISFRPSGYRREYSVIIRKTMDGRAGHLRLESKVVNVKLCDA